MSSTQRPSDEIEEKDSLKAEKSPANGAAGSAPETETVSNLKFQKRRIVVPILLLLAAAAIFYGIRFWQFNSSHVSTDDAFLTSDVIQISPQISGTLNNIYVKENELVHKGELLATIEDSTYRANVAQAKANLDAAIAQAKGAGVSVALTTQTGAAQVEQAQGIVAQAQSGISMAQADVAKNDAQIAGARASEQSAMANVLNAQAAVSAAYVNRERAKDAINSAQAQVDTARAAVKSAQANVESNQATYDKTQKDAVRVAELYKAGAISEQQADLAVATVRQVAAALESAKQGVAQANAVVQSRIAELNAAKQQYHASGAAISQAKAQLSAVRELVNAAKATIRQANSGKMAAVQNVQSAIAKKSQAAGQLSQAKTAPAQVNVSRSAQTQAAAKIEQAKAALDAAKIQLAYTRITAPRDGRINKKTVEVGQLVQAGTPLMAIIPDKDVWVVANFKETQLQKVHPGQSVEIEVDAYPGKKFMGKVDSISSATGSTFALLPADNATGNFTKVVQRVPIKIVLEDQQDVEDLRAGMSVTAVVDIR